MERILRRRSGTSEENMRKEQRHRIAYLERELAVTNERMAKMEKLWETRLGAAPDGQFFKEAREHFRDASESSALPFDLIVIHIVLPKY